ncbi:hypothetical protein FACS1894111_03270 [Clostridia bacterium]|nr:hypothetical protein FACS1894111_03270 [Clostridia bacterium]
MGSKTRIIVLHMKEVIYTAVFAALGILLILLLIFMFLPDKKEINENKGAKETMQYASGEYHSSVSWGDKAVDVKVVVDHNRIAAIELCNMEESVAAMYPLMQPSLEHISKQIREKNSLSNITYSEENQYTSAVLMGAIKQALEKARVE